jgi:hypothetical protein
MARSTQTSSRADKARARRNKLARKPAKSVRKRSDISARQVPPVMVRGEGYEPIHKSKTKTKKPKIKRRYDIALATSGTPGVEIRLPSLPVVRFGWRFLSFILVVGLGALLYYLWTSPVFQVQNVEIEGAIRLTPEEIDSALNVSNQPIFSLNPEELEADLKNTFVELIDVSVQIGLPASVLVNVNERVPMIAWIEESGTQWIDGNGYIFDPRGEVGKLVTVHANASPPTMIQIQVDEASPQEEANVEDDLESSETNQPETISPDLVAAILVLQSQAQDGAELVYDSQHGFGWRDSRGWDVYFGTDIKDIETKILVYRSIVKKLRSEKIIPVLVNVEHVHAPYYRLEQ